MRMLTLMYTCINNISQKSSG